MLSSTLEFPDLYQIEADNSPLMGNRTAVFVTEEERFWLRQEEVVPPRQFGRFIGRVKELQILGSAIANRAPLVTISGAAGVGKTALVQRLLHRYPTIAHVSVRDFNDPWTSIASALLSTYGKIPADVVWPSLSVPSGLSPHGNPMVIVFDDLDRFPTRRTARKQLLKVMSKLRPALGEWLTVIIVSRDIASFADETMANTATTIQLEPLSTEARYAFLTESAMDIGVQLEPETSRAIADSSFGLPIILKSFLAHSVEQMTTTTKKNEPVNLASFRGAIADSFADLALTYDTHLLPVEKLRPSDWQLVETMAHFDIFHEVNVRQLQEQVAVNTSYSDREMNRTLRRLTANAILTVERSNSCVYIHSHMLFAFIRAAQQMESSFDPKSGALLMLTTAAKKARAAARS